MADMITTPATPSLIPVRWNDDFFREYIRENEFSAYMGKSPNSIIQLNEDLTRQPGDTIVFNAVRKLIGAGVTGNVILEGNEEILDTHGMKILVNPLRHAVAVTDWDEQRSTVDLLQAARPALKDWMLERMRNDLIYAFEAVAPNTPFATATTAQRDAWLSYNADRVLFGAANSNFSLSSATALANVGTGAVGATTGKLSASVVSLAKRKAKMAKPAIRPIRVQEGGKEWFLMYANSLSFRDLKNDPTYRTDLQFALERGKNNVLFTDGDLIHDGVIIREVPEFPIYTGIGANGTDVGLNVLCGAQALGVAWARRTKTAVNERDYQWRHGVGISEIRGIDKLRFGARGGDLVNPIDQGMVTVFSNATADA